MKLPQFKYVYGRDWVLSRVACQMVDGYRWPLDEKKRPGWLPLRSLSVSEKD